MLATITLATPHGWVGTWIGSTVGMVAADALVIVVAACSASDWQTERFKYGAAATFAVSAVWLLVNAISQLA
jgi:putative Ca2+/H+ antiporter (TMEM165/GDT1 family)